MFSLTTILSIYAEIFTAGLLLSGLYGIIMRYKFSKKKAIGDVYLSLVFLTFFLYVAGTVISQLMFNFDRPLSELILINKLISADIIMCSSFLVLFIIEDFFSVRIIPFLFFCFVSIIFISAISMSQVNLVFGQNVIEPIAQYSLYIPIKIFWVIAWVISALIYLWKSIRTAGEGSRNLFLLGFLSSIFIIIANFCVYAYILKGEASLLLLSWVISFFGVIGLYLSRIIQPDAEIAKMPFMYFRTRILFKLIFIFVLLIAILFQATVLFTVSLSRQELKNRIIEGHKSAAQSIASQIETTISSTESTDIIKIQKIVEDYSSLSQSGWVYVFDAKGNIIAHPDITRVRNKENNSSVILVSELLAGKSMGTEFYNKEGDRMVGAAAPIKKMGLGVAVEEPSWLAYSEIRKMENSSIIFSIIGIVFTVLIGTFFARNIEKSIYTLIEGTEAVKDGDLSYQIKLKSVDEIGRLAGAINSMTNELRESQEHLIAAEKLGALGTMAAGMAHEIKNPLVSLRTFTQLMPQKWGDEEFRKKFSTILPVEIEKINKIVEHLLRFGRPSKPEMKSVNINDVLDEVLGLLDSECKKYNVRVNTKFSEIPEIMGDMGQLSQAFVNIILNAIQSMPNGGELSIKTDAGQIIKLGRVNKYGVVSSDGETTQISWEEGKEGKPRSVVFIEISDSGMGIPEENLRSLFDPFFTTKPKGTGMGLAITLRIIEEHKGSIKVRSGVGKGTTFIITLPQLAEEYHHKLLDNRVERRPKDGMP